MNESKEPGAFTGGTADEFMEHYSAASGVTVACLRSIGCVPFYVSDCADYDYPHWEMGYITDDAFNRRNEIKPC